jgi:N-acetylneuraminic acid mutarotase
MKTNHTIAGWLTLLALLTFNLQPSTAFAQGGVWAEKSPMPTPRYGVELASINGILYAVGGEQMGGVMLPTVEAYDPASNTWTNMAPMSTARCAHAVDVVNGILYSIGGRADDAAENLLNSVEAYDPASNTWTTKTPMPTARRNLAVGVVNGTIYAVGGLLGPNSSSIGTVEAYDPVSNTWTTKAPMPTARDSLGVGVINGILYAVGGTVDGWFQCNTVEAYDPVSNTWMTKAPVPESGWMQAGVVNGILYACIDDTPPSLFAYNPVTDTWTTNAPDPTLQHIFGVGVSDGVLFVVGGISENNTNLPTTEAFMPNSLTINMYAGLTLCGQIGNTYEIDYCNNLGASNWTALTTMVLSNSPYLYIDTNSTYFSQRFYRVVQQ